MSSFWQALIILKLLIASFTSVLLVFLKFSTESGFFLFMLIILGCWSNIFVAIDNGLLIAFGSNALLFIKFGIFKLEMISEKKILKIQHNSTLSETFLPSWVRLLFSLFFFLVWAHRPTQRRKCRGVSYKLNRIHFVWGNLYTKFVILDIKYRFTCGD